MKPKGGYYLKSIKKTVIPSRFLFIDAETLKYKKYNIDLHKMRLAITCYVRIGKTPGDIVSEAWSYFKTQYDICNYINHISYGKSPLWIIASNPRFDIGAIGLIKYFTEWNWQLEFLGEKGLIFILTLKNKDKRVKIIAIQNYLSTSIKKIGDWIGKPKLDIDIFTEDMDLLKKYCKRDVEILRDGFFEYLKFVYDNKFGNFALTKSAQSFITFRHRFMSHKILIHKRQNVSEFERASYHGGRVECFRIGKQIKQDYILLDVNSMYPYVMYNNSYPCEILGHVQAHNLNHLKTLLRHKCVTARVKIQTDEPVYAKTINKKCCFPIGIFYETLNTRALIYAVKHNHLLDISSGFYYREGMIFKKYIKHFWNMRLKAQKEKNVVLEQLIKIMLNSLYGKWAQQIPVLIDTKKEKENKFTVEHWYNAMTKEYGLTRTLFHKTETFMSRKDSRYTNVGISAHITEDARLYLWHIIKLCGLENVYYCDTDSLVVTKETYNRCLKKLCGKELGEIKIEQESNVLDIYTLKDYKFGDKVVCKGIGSNKPEINKDTYEVLTGYSMTTLMKLGIQDAAILTTVEKHLSRIYNKGVVTKEGVVHPFVLNEQENDELPQFQLF